MLRPPTNPLNKSRKNKPTVLTQENVEMRMKPSRGPVMNSARAMSSSNADRIILDRNDMESIPYLNTINKELDKMLPSTTRAGKKKSGGSSMGVRPMSTRAAMKKDKKEFHFGALKPPNEDQRVSSRLSQEYKRIAP